MTYQVRNQEIEELLRSLGRRIGREMPEGWGFTVFLFQNEGKSIFYISTAERESMLMAMKEFIARNSQ